MVGKPHLFHALAVLIPIYSGNFYCHLKNYRMKNPWIV
jgi:hypothetical protein